MTKVKDQTKPDPELKDFFRNPNRFADLFNAVCFGGDEIIQPEHLQELDTDVSGIIATKEYRESLARHRDIIKQGADGLQLMILGIENQMQVDKQMPLRVLVYDSMNYLKELNDTKKEKTKLTPIITIVMYYGNTNWNGPTSLKEMMEDLPPYLENVVSDYKMNLVEVLHDTKYKFHNKEVQMLFEYGQAIKNKEKEKITQLEEKYPLNEDVIYALAKFIDIKEAVNKIKKEESEGIQMCELFDDIREEGRASGIEEGEALGTAKGTILTLRKLKYTDGEIVKFLITELEINEEKAKEYVG